MLATAAPPRGPVELTRLTDGKPKRWDGSGAGSRRPELTP
jgi:hypothetical protein